MQFLTCRLHSPAAWKALRYVSVHQETSESKTDKKNPFTSVVRQINVCFLLFIIVCAESLGNGLQICFIRGISSMDHKPVLVEVYNNNFD